MLLLAGCNKKTETTVKNKAPESAPAQQPVAVNMPAAAPTLPEVIIEVNGEKFTRDAAMAEIDQRLASVKSQIPPERVDEIKFRMVDQLVERFVVKTLLMNEVKKANLTATPAEIDERLGKFKASLPKEMAFADILKKNNVTEEKVREDIASDIKISKLFAPITNGITATAAEITEHIDKNKEQLTMPETVRASHILVAVAKTDDEKTKTEKKAKIDKLKADLDKGGDFAALAKANSDCPSKEMGGDLGKFRKGQMAKPFEDAAFAQATNVIGSVVETEFGYHIIKVMEHQAAGMASKEEVAANLTNQKCDEALRKFIGGLSQKATIKDNRPPRNEPPMGMGMPGMPMPGGQGHQAPAPAPAPEAAREKAPVAAEPAKAVETPAPAAPAPAPAPEAAKPDAM